MRAPSARNRVEVLCRLATAMIFVSYSQEDDEWRKRFLKMVKPLERYEEIKFWSDRDIEPGKNWKKEIDAAMRSASVAVLLVSYNFLASDFIANEGLPFFLDAARDHKGGVMWGLITPCLWKNTRLKNI